MDLRRFLVFFVLMFFVSSVSVFSDSSIFGIENITYLPYDAEDNDYIIGYSNYSKSIFIAVYRSGVDVEFFNIVENGVYDEKGNLLEMYYRTYKADVGEWSTYAAAHKYGSWFTELNPLYSNKDVYHNGQIYILGKKYDGNLGVMSGLTYSLIFISLIKPFLRLMPFVLAFIVLFIAFIKAWKFVKGAF